MVGVWIEPVMAQVMTTLLASWGIGVSSSLQSIWFQAVPWGLLAGARHDPQIRRGVQGGRSPSRSARPEAPRGLSGPEHDGDRDCAEHHQVEGAEIGERLAQQEENERTDDRTLDAANAADHGDEDHEGGPVVDAEGGVRRDAQLLQENQRAEHGGAKHGDDIDDELDPD